MVTTSVFIAGGRCCVVPCGVWWCWGFFVSLSFPLLSALSSGHTHHPPYKQLFIGMGAGAPLVIIVGHCEGAVNSCIHSVKQRLAAVDVGAGAKSSSYCHRRWCWASGSSCGQWGSLGNRESCTSWVPHCTGFLVPPYSCPTPLSNWPHIQFGWEGGHGCIVGPLWERTWLKPRKE